MWRASRRSGLKRLKNRLPIRLLATASLLSTLPAFLSPLSVARHAFASLHCLPILVHMSVQIIAHAHTYIYILHLSNENSLPCRSLAFGRGSGSRMELALFSLSSRAYVLLVLLARLTLPEDRSAKTTPSRSRVVCGVQSCNGAQNAVNNTITQAFQSPQTHTHTHATVQCRGCRLYRLNYGISCLMNKTQSAERLT